MYNNPYYNPQANIDRINSQIAELEKMKSQIPLNNIQPNQQPTSINQTFQLSPNNQNSIKYANSIDDVNKELVIGDTPFFSKDMSMLWVKNVKGEVKAYGLTEIIQKDDKDLMIESLQYQIQELRKEIKDNAKSNDTSVDEPTEKSKSTTISKSRTVKTK